MSNAADEHIRVTEQVKRALENRKREGESYNDVLERLLEDDRDLLAGFGAFKGTDRGETMREVHDRGKEKSRKRIDAMAERRSDG
jgi:predicted CopG family antitoxin